MPATYIPACTVPWHHTQPNFIYHARGGERASCSVNPFQCKFGAKWSELSVMLIKKLPREFNVIPFAGILDLLDETFQSVHNSINFKTSEYARTDSITTKSRVPQAPPKMTWCHYSASNRQKFVSGPQASHLESPLQLKQWSLIETGGCSSARRTARVLFISKGRHWSFTLPPLLALHTAFRLQSYSGDREKNRLGTNICLSV